MPTLIMAGDHDIFCPATLLQETAACIPNSRLVFYNGLGHDAMFTKQLANGALAFLISDDPASLNTQSLTQ